MGKLRILALVAVVGAAGLAASVVGAALPAPAAAAAAPVVAPAPVAAPAASAGPAPTSMAAGAPCIASARACVQLSTNQAWLLENGAVTYGPTPIRHGRAGWRTPPGTFKVTFKNRYHRSTIFSGAPMPFAVFFNGGIAFHQGSLGSLSHGCIRMTMQGASTFFATLQPGDVVQVVR